jgi:aminoglycoside phosphotransferase (APT) family kinase protein
MGTYRPHAPFAGRFDLARRLQRAVQHGDLEPDAATLLSRQAADDPPAIVFAHGDITARNVLRSDSTGEAVLIDWEWAGRYPRGWDLAFLWFTLVDLPGGRSAVEAAVPARDLRWFWRSALLVQLLHLSLGGLAPGTPFRPKHERMRDELLERALALG